MTPEHVEELRKLVIQNSGPTDKTVNLALFGVALEFYNKLERITVAFETIAKGSVIEFKIGDTKEQFESVVAKTVQKMIRNRTISL